MLHRIVADLSFTCFHRMLPLLTAVDTRKEVGLQDIRLLLKWNVDGILRLDEKERMNAT